MKPDTKATSAMIFPSLTGAAFNRGRSAQDVQTPLDFLAAIKARFGEINWDLAATEDNCVGRTYFGPEHDSLSKPWGDIAGLVYLNPPFDDIKPWVRKASETLTNRPALSLVLLPASVGSQWFEHHVVGYSYVIRLLDRLRFVGQSNPYPKDLLLAVYGFGIVGMASWRWKAQQL